MLNVKLKESVIPALGKKTREIDIVQYVNNTDWKPGWTHRQNERF